MEKQTYETPTIEVIELYTTPQLLAQSGGKKSPEEVEDMWGG